MIFLGLAAIWGFYWTLRNRNFISGLVTLGLIVAIILIFLKPNNSSLLGIYVFLAFSAFALLYVLLIKRPNFAKRMVIALIILPVLVYWVFILYHFPGAAWIKYGFFLPFIALIYGIIRSVNLKNEWGFVIILLAEALTHIYPLLINQKLF